MRDKNNELVVVKANRMIQEYKYTLSKMEIRIVNTIISNISSPKYDQELNTMEFDIREFSKMLGLEDAGGKNYKAIKEALHNLSNKSSDYIDFGEYETIVRWIDKPVFEKKSGKVKLKLDDDLKPFFLQASGSIHAKLRYYFEMDSKYSMRLYELLKSYDGFKFAKFEIDKLRTLIDATKKSYSNFAMFKRSVLDPAVEEINDVTDLIVSYTVRTSGRKVTHVDFSIRKKKNAAVILEQANVDSKSISNVESSKKAEKKTEEKSSTKKEKRLDPKLDMYRDLVSDINEDWSLTEEQLSYIISVIRKKCLPYFTFEMDLLAKDLMIYDVFQGILKEASAKGGGKTSLFGWLNKMFSETDIVERNIALL